MSHMLHTIYYLAYGANMTWLVTIHGENPCESSSLLCNIAMLHTTVVLYANI